MLTAKENYKFHVPYKGLEVYDADAVYHLVSMLNSVFYIMDFLKIRNSCNKLVKSQGSNPRLLGHCQVASLPLAPLEAHMTP